METGCKKTSPMINIKRIHFIYIFIYVFMKHSHNGFENETTSFYGYSHASRTFHHTLSMIDSRLCINEAMDDRSVGHGRSIRATQASCVESSSIWTRSAMSFASRRWSSAGHLLVPLRRCDARFAVVGHPNHLVDDDKWSERLVEKQLSAARDLEEDTAKRPHIGSKPGGGSPSKVSAGGRRGARREGVLVVASHRSRGEAGADRLTTRDGGGGGGLVRTAAGDEASWAAEP